MTTTEPTTINTSREPVVLSHALPSFVDGKIPFFKGELAVLTTTIFDETISLDDRASALVKRLIFITLLSAKKFPETFAQPANTAFDLFKLLVDNENLWKQMEWVGGVVEAVSRSKLLENKDNFDEFVLRMITEGVFDEMLTTCQRWCCY